MTDRWSPIVGWRSFNHPKKGHQQPSPPPKKRSLQRISRKEKISPKRTSSKLVHFKDFLVPLQMGLFFFLHWFWALEVLRMDKRKQILTISNPFQVGDVYKVFIPQKSGGLFLSVFFGGRVSFPPKKWKWYTFLPFGLGEQRTNSFAIHHF